MRKSLFHPTLIITLTLIIMFTNTHVMKAETQPITVSRSMRIESGYAVPGHPQSHIALFKTESLVNTSPHLLTVFFFIVLGLGIFCIVLISKMRRDRLQEKTDWGVLSLDTTEAVDKEEAFLRIKRLNDMLLAEIKSLDTQFTSGEISEKRYQDLRKYKKEMLVQVKIKLKDLRDS